MDKWVYRRTFWSKKISIYSGWELKDLFNGHEYRRGLAALMACPHSPGWAVAGLAGAAKTRRCFVVTSW